MSQRRRYGADFAYSEAHRLALPGLYKRIGHRLDMADRDLTEFCHWCKKPLAIYEEVRDVGQDLRDKATTVTKRLATMAGIPAFLVAWRIERPAETQNRIDELNREVLRLQLRDPIAAFTARRIHPRPGAFVSMTPAEWWLEGVLAIHRAHHATCRAAQGREIPVDTIKLLDACVESRLWTQTAQMALVPSALEVAL